MPELVDVAMQTNWKYPKNAVVQCQPREFTEEEKLAIHESEELAEFLRNVSQRFVVFLAFFSLCVAICDTYSPYSYRLAIHLLGYLIIAQTVSSVQISPVL